MHQMLCADDSVDRASVAAVCATDAVTFVDYRDTALNSRLFGERQDFFAEQARQSLHCFVATRRTQIYGDAVFDNSGSVRAATRITTLGALRLRQQVINLFNQTGRLGWQ
jgi:hypothetical protein